MATVETTTERPIGFGRLKRKEDARFIRGKGTYLDDIRLPGMVHGVMLRSPYAHAKILSIDTSRARAHPRVAAVVTPKAPAPGLAWMPTISYDTQACSRATRSVSRGEVAFTPATSTPPGCPRAIDVDVNARRRSTTTPAIRDDKDG
jgi:carbon-monoxide dehydrogenase large subunit